VGFLVMLTAFTLPWICMCGVATQGAAQYGLPLVVLAIWRIGLTYFALRGAISQMEVLRREEYRKPRKITGALTLTDNRPISTRIRKRGQTASRIHPLAFPVRGHALFWKECIKDGTDYSLRVHWLSRGLAVVLVLAGSFQFLHFINPPRQGEMGIRALAWTLTFTTYFVAVTAYALVVVFQMTMTVAGEREQDTLPFLLMIPDSRATILLAKWVGPWWRNWPILAIAYLGVLLGLASGLYNVPGALFLLLIPWPSLLMLGGLALWLSVTCRRVLFANITVIAFLGILAIVHIAVGKPIVVIFAYYLAILGAPAELALLGDTAWSGLDLALLQQALFLLVATVCVGHAFWLFGKKDYAAS
jgi:ABC-type transport system involved in multi-copper enzyme maturation permease subunit